MTQLQKVLAALNSEHHDILVQNGSDKITTMEDYYFQQPHRFRKKIAEATWIPKSERKHMILHVAARLRAKAERVAKERGRVRKITFRQFVQDPAAVKVTTRRNVYGKRRNGAVHKQSRKTGRFVAFSQAERREVHRKR